MEFYVPAAFSKQLLASHGDHEVNVVGRIEARSLPTGCPRRSRLDLRVFGGAVSNTNKGMRAVIGPLHDDLVLSVRDSLFALFGASL